ncbi:MAG: hypothetical protein ACPG47_00830 [Leucothrix sp.]
MPALFVNSLVVLVLELGLFALLWLQNTSVTLCVVLAHLALSALAGLWYSQRWANTSTRQRHTQVFIAGLVALLPVIGSMFLFLIDNRTALRQYGLNEGLGSEEIPKETPQDLLNYFSAPDRYTKGNVRKTKDLLSSLDDESYLGLLIASRHLSDKEAYALLSEALFSPFESARLMAYSLRGKLEDRMSEARQEKLNSLNETTSAKQKAELHLSLAKDFLHLLDVQTDAGDRGGLLNKAKQHCIHALKIKQSSVGFKTLSKVLKAQGNAAQAQQAEQRSHALATA